MIARPLLMPTAFYPETSELEVSEKADLLRFLESLEFEHQRGLIAEAEFIKQKAKVNKRLEALTVN